MTSSKSKSIMFVDEPSRTAIRGWFDRFRTRIPVATEEAVVTTSFGRTHALIGGPRDAPPLVMLHGALASSAHVLPELGPLLRTRRVYALDIVGQSVMSDDRRVELGDDSYGRWLAEATTALGLDRFDLYGVSWGGFVALRGACFMPERVKKLVLLVPAGWVANSAWAGLRDAGWPMLMYRAFPSEKRLARVMRAMFSTPDQDWTAYFGEALRAYKLDMRIPPLVQPADVARLSCPTLVFGADEDASFPGKALVARARELVPSAEVELLERSKHCPPQTEEFRARMATRIERFLG